MLSPGTLASFPFLESATLPSGVGSVHTLLLVHVVVPGTVPV